MNSGLKKTLEKNDLIIIKHIKANLQFVMDFELVFFVHNEKAMMCYSKD